MTAVDEVNKKLSLAKNLAWLASALFVVVTGLAIWTWTQLTEEFLKVGDEVTISLPTEAAGQAYLTGHVVKGGQIDTWPDGRSVFSLHLATGYDQRLWTIERP